MTGEDLKRRRERLGLTQEALARRLDVTKMSIFRYEKSKSVPRVVELALKSIERDEVK